MPDPTRGLQSAVLWTLTAPPHETTSCLLRLTPAGWRLRVTGLRVPLEWIFATEPDARRRASTMQRDLMRLGWHPLHEPRADDAPCRTEVARPLDARPARA